MSTVSQTALNSQAVQKLYEDRLSQSAQRGSGIIDHAISGIVGNVVKAVKAGRRMQARKGRKVRARPKVRKNNLSVRMTGKGRKKVVNPRKKKKTAATKRKCIRRRKPRGIFTCLQKGRGVGRTNRRRSRRPVRI